MENKKAYLNKLPLIFLIVLAGVVVQEFFFNTLNRTIENQEQIRRNLIFSQAIHFTILFVGLGLALNKWKNALISLGTAALVMVTYSFLSNDKLFGESTTEVAMRLIAGELLYILPSIIFFVLSKIAAKKIINIIIALIILRGLTGTYFIAQGIGALKDNLNIDLENYKQYITVAVSACMFIFKIIFYCELENYVNGKEMKWQPRLLNPGNVYENLSATIVFFTLKVFIIAMVIGQAFQLYSLKFFMRDEFASFLRVYYYSNILNMLFGVAIVLFATWYLRKFLLEYFVTYNMTSKLVYWFTLLPGIGFIVWLFCLQNERAKNFSEKVASINNFAGSGTQAVTTIIVIVMSLRFVFGLAGQTAGVDVFAGILSLLLFVWLINQRSGYYFNLYLSFTLLLILLIVILWGSERRYFVVFCAAFSLVLYNAVQLLLIYPVYHFEDFSYIDNEAAAADEEEDVLAGFETD